MTSHGIDVDFCQDNHSCSTRSGTLRGLHFQIPPYAQAKLVRCVKGRIFDVAVDIRPASPTFKQWVGIELSATAGSQLFIPAGYAHGFVTLEDECEVIYKVDQYYVPEAEGGIAWNDPALAIDWPVEVSEVLLSAKDENLAVLKNLELSFEYDGCPMQLIQPDGVM